MASRWLPLWTGILPIVAIHATYVVAAIEGYVPWCIPYIDSCTSISATGRNGTAFFLFKATMIPSAVLLYFFWRQASRLLAELQLSGPVPLPPSSWWFIQLLLASQEIFSIFSGESGSSFTFR